MKALTRIAALSTLSCLALVAGCNNSGRVESEGATTTVETCEKGEACCKATGSMADCKASCESGKSDCSGASSCSDKN